MKKLAAWIMPVLGFLFLTAYIRSATVDVVYTDYIRIVNTYLPQAWSFKPYLQPDILTRVPISYIERIISTYIFGYSTTFDMIMGAIGLTLTAIVIARFANRRKLSLAITLALLFVVFALDKWEMLTNGTGWMHFWAFALFYEHYYIYDKLRDAGGSACEDGAKVSGCVAMSGNGKAAQSEGGAKAGEGKRDVSQVKSRDEIALRVLPFVTILLFAGPYCVIYAGAMGIIYVVDYIAGHYDATKIAKKDWILRAVCLAIPFVLFCISKYLSVDEYAGATDETLMQVIKGDPTLLPKMVLKSFASMVIGGETAMEYGISNKVLYLFGLFIIAAYVYAIYLNIKNGLYRKTAFPMLLIVSGLISHAIVVWGRWIFKSPDYMMSSRYALQFQSGILGIMLTLNMAWKPEYLSMSYLSNRAAAKGVRTVCGQENVKAEDGQAAKVQDNKNIKEAGGQAAKATGGQAAKDAGGQAAKATGRQAAKDVGGQPEGIKPSSNKGLMKAWEKVAVIAIMVVVLVGHLVTTGREINMAQYRKVAFENVREVALNYENENDKTLKAVLQYSKPDMTRNALKILEDANLNVFR